MPGKEMQQLERILGNEAVPLTSDDINLIANSIEGEGFYLLNDWLLMTSARTGKEARLAAIVRGLLLANHGGM